MGFSKVVDVVKGIFFPKNDIKLTTNQQFYQTFLVRKYYWPPPAFLLAKLPNPRIQQQRGEMDSRWTKHVQLVALFDSISDAHHVSVDGDSNFVNNFVKKKPFENSDRWLSECLAHEWGFYPHYYPTTVEKLVVIQCRCIFCCSAIP